jgi:hypothetical protein
MKIKCIGCDSLARIVYHCAAISPHRVDVELLRLGLHVQPKKLNIALQESIDEVPDQTYDAIVLGYGLCGQATKGIKARNTPLVIPKAHDCITLYLGSRDRYMDEHEKYPGTIWYTKDYVERSRDSKTSVYLGADFETNNPSMYEKYIERYGREKADYLMKIMGDWQKHYDRMVFIDQGIIDTSGEESKAKADAEAKGWRFEKMTGDLLLIRQLLFGEWNDDFLIAKPGDTITMAFGKEILTVEDTE